MPRVAGLPGKIIGRAKWELSKLLGQHEVLFILARELGRPEDRERPSGVKAQWVNHPSSAGFAEATRIATQAGVDPQWCEKKVAEGDSIVVVLDDGGSAGAMAWVGVGQLWVDDLEHFCIHADDQCSFYSDWVSMGCRGRGWQRALVRERISMAGRQGKRIGYSVVKKSNRVSLRNYLSEGFKKVGRVDMWRSRGRTVAFLRILTHRLEFPRLEFRGWPSSRFFHFIQPSLSA